MTNAIGALLKEHAAVLERRETARRAFVEADADARALGQLIRDQGAASTPGAGDHKIDWLRASERVGAAYFEVLLPEASPDQLEEAYLRWKATLSQFSAV